jgi:hypothetical protein
MPHAAKSFVEPERLFAMLNGRSVAASGHRWLIEVFSISHHSGHRWVQLALSGPTQHFLTLRLTAGDGADRLVPALLSWLTHPSGSGQILNVA